jgi:YD repeat-containing protein
MQQFNRFRATALVSTALVSTILIVPQVRAQTAPAPETYRNNDGNGVDVTTGTFNPAIVEGDVGNGGEGIKLIRYWGQSGYRDNWTGELRVTGTAGAQAASLNFGNITAKFTQSGSNWVNTKADGAKLTSITSGTDTIYTYTEADGTKITYNSVTELTGRGFDQSVFTVQMASSFCTLTNSAYCGLPTAIVDPDGSSYSLTWHTPSKCTFDAELNPVNCDVAYRLIDVRSKSSYAMKAKYQSDSWPQSSPAPHTNWPKRSGAKFYDLSQVYCDSAALNCDSVSSVSSVTYSNPNAATTNITDENGGTWVLTLDGSGRLSGIRRPGSATDTTTVGWGTNGRVSSVTDDGEITNYSWTLGATTTVTATTGAGEAYH